MSPFKTAVEANVAAQIKVTAKREKISQAALAEAAGVSRETMNAYLSGRTPIPLPALIAVCERIGLSLHALAARASGLDVE